MIAWLHRAVRGQSADARAAPPQQRKLAVAVAGRELPVVVRRLRNARRLTLRLAPDGSEARVSMPAWGRVADALEFARSRADWLAQQLDRLPPPQPVGHDALVLYRGEQHRVIWQERAARRPVIVDGQIMIGGPADGLERRLHRWLAAEALRLCAQDLTHYCARAGQPLPRLALSRAQRRWGSCASDGTIRINWRLIMAPDAVRRSVVAHEVAHMTHFDHSPAFHAHLGALYEGSLSGANEWLRLHGRTLYQPFG
ncbi:M48 family metallopeptidase [Novosphingobium sp.]|uniref:M48 family metallopeptidase n=1 Tax=Novosphingobium sp. TaxID=1874826 RepID=UPI0038BD96CD